MDLAKIVAEQLGVDENQAKAGLGLIFQLVQQKTSSEEFEQINSSAPEVTDFVKFAEANVDTSSGGLMDLVGSLASKLTGSGGLSDLASLASSFNKLGLKPEMLLQFVPVILKFFESKGGVAVVEILKKVLASK